MEPTTSHAPLLPHSTLSAPLACPRCGTIDSPVIAPGNGPHAFRALCHHCGVFIQWISQYAPAERQARRQAARNEAMASKPPSPLQLDYLAALGHVGPPPATMLEASQRIDRLTEKA